MDKKTIGLIIIIIVIGFPFILFVGKWLYYKVYYTGIGKNKRDKQGKTFLIKAVEAGNRKLVEGLLKKGAAVNLQDCNGRSALMYAFIKGNREIINLLLSKSADINVLDVYNESILIWYLLAGQKEMVKMLLSLGADPNLGRKDGKMPIMIAAEKGDNELIDLLIARKVNLNHKDEEGRSALSYVCRSSCKYLTYSNLIKMYSGDYCDKNYDIDLFIQQFKEKKDTRLLKKFFFAIREFDYEIRKKVADNYFVNALVNDADMVSVLKKDFIEYYSFSDKIQYIEKFPFTTLVNDVDVITVLKSCFINCSMFDKIQFLNKFPEIFEKPFMDKSSIKNIFLSMEENSLRDEDLKDFLKILKRMGYETNLLKTKCELCNGKGEHSDYSSFLERDNYCYPCSCFKGKQIQATVKLNGKEIIDYKSKDYKKSI